VDLRFRENFKQESISIPQRLNKAVWNIISIIIGIVLFLIPGVGWGIIIAWTVISIVVNQTWSHQEVVAARRDAREERARLAALGRGVKPGSLGIENGGQLINTRKSQDPLRVIYGIVKTGGTWVFNKMSRANDEIMNTVISWGEGELTGLGTGIDVVPIFSGVTTLNDLRLGGEFAYAGCACDMTCYSYSPCGCDMTCHVYV
jgi:hypothetical protein